MRTLTRLALSIGAAALLAGCAASQLPIGASRATTDTRGALPHQKTFTYTGAEQSFKVPAGVTSLNVDVRGAAGAGMFASYHSGRGGRVRATISVQPTQTLYVFVGGEGSSYKGGFNGGADGGTGGSFCDYGWGGGGASDVRENGDTLSDRILVAGGGGGAGDYFNSGPPNGGAGGGKQGGAGTEDPSGGGGGGGGGGTQKHGGAGGYAGGPYYPGQPGAHGKSGVGGSGGVCGHTHYAGGSGGGGGGGYYGGGGGGGGAYLSAGGGAGGGSGYVAKSAVKSAMWRGWKSATGNGLVVFSWQ